MSSLALHQVEGHRSVRVKVIRGLAPRPRRFSQLDGDGGPPVSTHSLDVDPNYALAAYVDGSAEHPAEPARFGGIDLEAEASMGGEVGSSPRGARGGRAGLGPPFLSVLLERGERDDCVRARRCRRCLDLVVASQDLNPGNEEGGSGQGDQDGNNPAPPLSPGTWSRAALPRGRGWGRSAGGGVATSKIEPSGDRRYSTGTAHSTVFTRVYTAVRASARAASTGYP